jgi:hypothetical protein
MVVVVEEERDSHVEPIGHSRPESQLQRERKELMQRRFSCWPFLVSGGRTTDATAIKHHYYCHYIKKQKVKPRK